MHEYPTRLGTDFKLILEQDYLYKTRIVVNVNETNGKKKCLEVIKGNWDLYERLYDDLLIKSKPMIE